MGHWDAATMDEEQRLSQTKVNVACRGWVRKKKKSLRQLLSDSLWRGAGEKAGFKDEDGCTDGNCTLIQTTEARGHWVPSSYPHVPPQATPLHVEGALWLV